MAGIYHKAGKFHGKLTLAVWLSTFVPAKFKSANITYLHIICMVIPYQIAKFTVVVNKKLTLHFHPNDRRTVSRHRTKRK